MALDIDGVGFVASLLGKLLTVVGVEAQEATLRFVGQLAIALFVLIIILTVVPGYVWVMRKVMADIQSRHGPTRVGPFGLLQTLADGVKLMTKEDIIPARADRFAFTLAPYFMLVPVILAFAPLPWSGGIILSDLGAGILFILAIGAVSPLGEILAGWSSNNKYAMYGGIRAAAMDVSYEIPMIISVVAVVFLSGTLSTQGIVAAQSEWWFFLLQPIGVVIFFASAMAKIGVIPVDLPEAESELVAGYFTEYTGIRFGVFFLSLFASVFLMAAITVTLFFGGWALLPPFGVAAVVLGFGAILLTRQPFTKVNVSPPALLGIFVGVLLTWSLGGFGPGLTGAGRALLELGWNAQVADHFLGPAATPGNFIATLVAAWEFLIPTAFIAAAVSIFIVKAEGGSDKDARLFPLVCASSVVVPPLALFTLAPFLYAGVENGLVAFVVGGLQNLILPIMPLVLILAFTVLAGGLALLLVKEVGDPILGLVLAVSGGVVPLLLIPFTSFLLKTVFFSFMVFWLWFTLPRVRIDQFLSIGWKTMFPLSLLTLVLAGFEAWLLRGGTL